MVIDRPLRSITPVRQALAQSFIFACKDCADNNLLVTARSIASAKMTEIRLAIVTNK